MAGSALDSLMRIHNSMKKTSRLRKPAPEGVSEEKFDSCVEQVKEDQGEDEVNPYAVCSASLQKEEPTPEKISVDEAARMIMSEKHDLSAVLRLMPDDKQDDVLDAIRDYRGKEDKPTKKLGPQEAAKAAMSGKHKLADVLRVMPRDEQNQVIEELKRLNGLAKGKYNSK